MSKDTLQPTYKRQRFLLSFIRQLKNGATMTDTQKLVFLCVMENNYDFYEFIPYKYGPYSFQLAEDVDILRRDGFLISSTSRIQAVGDYQCEMPFPIASERGDNLIRKAYREYSYYAINSEILERLFERREVLHFHQIKTEYVQGETELFTIGYEGKSLEAFTNTLIQNNIRLLCDVRRNPLSRKFGFSKTKLEHVIKNVGIQYVHVPELGIESEKRSSLDTAEDYEMLFADYAKTLPTLTTYLEYVHSLLLSYNRIALMCYEKEPQMCHRHVIRDNLVQMYGMRSKDL